MPKIQALLDAAPESLWGLRTHGVFHPPDQKQQALDWLESAKVEFGSYYVLAQEVGQHVRTPLGQLGDNLRAAKLEADGLGMTMLTVVAGLRASEGLPPIRPDMSGNEADVIARARWALFATECNSNMAEGARLGRKNGSYLRTVFKRGTPPSVPWRTAFCAATGFDRYWLDTGIGEGPVLDPVSIDSIKGKRSSGRIPAKPRVTDRQRQVELETRQKKAKRREDIGLRGECHCYDAERIRLNDLGRADLAGQVELVSFKPSNDGYDLLTFDDAGSEIHVEIKTTTRSKKSMYGFWLTQNEWQAAKEHAQWQLWRVWDLDGEPEIENLGNVVRDLPTGWNHEPDSHRFYSNESDLSG